jgi:hypothetical protein
MPDLIFIKKNSQESYYTISFLLGQKAFQSAAKWLETIHRAGHNLPGRTDCNKRHKFIRPKTFCDACISRHLSQPMSIAIGQFCRLNHLLF